MAPVSQILLVGANQQTQWNKGWKVRESALFLPTDHQTGQHQPFLDKNEQLEWKGTLFACVLPRCSLNFSLMLKVMLLCQLVEALVPLVTSQNLQICASEKWSEQKKPKEDGIFYFSMKWQLTDCWQKTKLFDFAIVTIGGKLVWLF